MIDEAVLERLLRDEAETYDVPEGGEAGVLADAAEYEGRRGPRWVGWVAAAAAVVAVAVGVPLTAGDDGGSPSAGRGGVFLANDDAGKTVGGGSEYGGGTVAPEDPAVVRTGEIGLEVPRSRVADTLLRARRVAAARGGFVAESDSTTDGDHPVGAVTIRVPVKEFDTAVEELSRLGDVRYSGTRGEDVTAEVTDVAARLESLVATRAQLRTLLARATDVADVLAVQQRLTETQTQIEQLQAKQESLAERTTYGTVHVTVSPPGGTDPEGFAGAWEDARDGFTGGFRGLLAASGTIAFALVVGLVLLLAGRAAYRYWLRGTV